MTEISTSPANYSSSPNWPALWSASLKIPTTSTTERWPANWPPPFKKVEAWSPPKISPPTKSRSASRFAASYRGYDIISAPPPSSGGVALIEILNILEGFDLAKFGNRSAETIHLKPKPSAAPSTIAPNSWAIPTSQKFPSRSSSTRNMLRHGATLSIRTMPARAKT